MSPPPQLVKPEMLDRLLQHQREQPSRWSRLRGWLDGLMRATPPPVTLESLQLEDCAVEIYQNCSFERHSAQPNTSAALPVDHAYVLHYTRNARRLSMQREQLPQLHIPFSIVTGYDREDIDGHHRACVLTRSARQDISRSINLHRMDSAYTSQVIKLLASLYDMMRHRQRTALIMEDDAIIRCPHSRVLMRRIHA